MACCIGGGERKSEISQASRARRSTLNFARAAGLAAAMVLLASGAGARPISCDPESEESADTRLDGAFFCQTVMHDFDATTSSNLYQFDAFTNRLSFFDNVLTDMTVAMSAFYVEIGNADFLSRIPNGFEPETFITRAFGPVWIYFRIEDLDGTDSPPVRGTHFDDRWLQHMVWFGDDNYNNPQVLHDSFFNGTDTFGNVVTVPDSFDPDPVCEGKCGPGDPAIDGTAGDFSDTTVVSTVPEPASLWLLGAGLGGFLYRRRRTGRSRALKTLGPARRLGIGSA